MTAKKNKYSITKTDLECNELFINKFVSDVQIPFYHWTSKTAADSIVSDKSFRFTNFKNFEDKKEFLHGIQLIKTFLLTECLFNEEFRNVFGRFAPHFQEILEDQDVVPYVVCFSKDKDNSYTKQKYGQAGGGQLIEVQFNQRDIGGLPICVDIIYDERVFHQKTRLLFYSYLEYIHVNGFLQKRDIFTSIMKDCFVLSSTLKQKKYIDEKETRLIAFSMDKHSPYLTYKFPRAVFNKIIL